MPNFFQLLYRKVIPVLFEFLPGIEGNEVNSTNLKSNIGGLKVIQLSGKKGLCQICHYAEFF